MKDHPSGYRARMPTGDPFDLPARLLEPEELQTLAEDVGGRPELWREQLGRCTAERTYVDLHTDEHVGVWAISWLADVHDTGFHDHDGSSGGVHVAAGAIRHEHLRLGRRPAGEAVAAGSSFCFDGSAIHRMRREPGAADTVTIHAYSPPCGTPASSARPTTGSCTAGPPRPANSCGRTRARGHPPPDRGRPALWCPAWTSRSTPPSSTRTVACSR